jgi:flagellar basal body-associated protein FliL
MESVRDNISDNTLQNQDRSNQNKRRFSADKNVKSRASKKSISTNKKSSGSKAFSAVIFLLILVLVGGGGAYAYLNFYQTSVPEVTSDQMMRSLSDSTSFEFRIIADSADAENETTSRLEIEGVVDLDPDNQTESYYVITSPDENRPPIQASMAETEIIQSVPDIQQETIKDILLTPDFITLGEFQTEERLGQTSENEGINTNRFGVTLNSSQLVSDYATFHQALLGDALSEEALSSVQSTIGAFAPTQGQVWLDSETNVPYQITLIGRGAENQDVQINIQFRNHGQTIETTSSYEPQSIEEVIIQHFSDTEAEQLDENENDTETTGDDLQNEQAVLRQIDQLRINNIQQISVALRMFVTENGFFPDTLDQLISDENAVLDSIPNDPLSSENDPYAYGISDTAEQYHLGTTLQQITRSETSRDANFNSAEQGYANGFNGASTSCLVSSDLQPVSICYDITDTVE